MSNIMMDGAEVNVELKPCPFCGGKAKIRQFRTFGEKVRTIETKYYVECEKCAAYPGSRESITEAISLWNNRAEIKK